MSSVQLWIDNAHVFSAYTLNPGARTAPTQIFCLLWDMVASVVIGQLLWGVSSLKPRGEKCIFQQFLFLFYACWHGIIVMITEIH